MAKNNDIIKGNGHINVSNVNAVSKECITLTYTIWNFKTQKQVTDIKNGIYDLVQEEVHFDLEVKDWDDDEEKLKLKIKVKACNSERKAHTIKKDIDQFIQKKGGQTTLDQNLEDDD